MNRMRSASPGTPTSKSRRTKRTISSRSIEESIRHAPLRLGRACGRSNTMPSRIKDILIENLEVITDRRLRDHSPARPQPSHESAQASATGPQGSAVPPGGPRQPKRRTRTSSASSGGAMWCCTIPMTPSLRSCSSSGMPPTDPSVLAIKQTLYRIGKESPLIPLFIQACGERQAGCGAGRTEGALRRGEQHRLGETA